MECQNLHPKPTLSVEKNFYNLKGKKKVHKPKALSFNSSYGSDPSRPSELDNTKEMLTKKIHFQEENKIKKEKTKAFGASWFFWPIGNGISWNIKKGKKSWTPRSN